MVIYLDYIFIENFLIDYILLKETSSIARKNVKYINIVISALIAAIYITIMLYFKIQLFNYLICKVLLIIVIIYISFKPKTVKEYLKLITIFFLMSVINVGTITVLTNILNLQKGSGIINIIVYITSFVLSRYFTGYMWKIYKSKIKNEELIYKVIINIGDKKYIYKAFLDTGNNVFSYTYNLPVLFAELVEEDMLNALENKEKFVIKTMTLSQVTNKTAYILDNVEIMQNGNNWKVKVAVVFERMKLSKDSSYNMLLNYNLYAQELGGIKI